jgi:DMSO/TMAO reductase YedYZ molybdopterin-dependent catalytic subunit
MTTRRKFIQDSVLTAFSLAIGSKIVFGGNMPEGYLPLALEQDDPYTLFGKDKGMVVLSDRPWNIEAQAHLLDDRITPASKMFVRNNGQIPGDIDITNWKLEIDGESVDQKKSYSLSELKSKFTKHTYELTLECAGNGRSEFYPPTEGNQWTVGGVSCAAWTGVRLSDVLKDVAIPMAKALQPETLLAFQMNGRDIPIAHGHPLRLVAGGWPASVCGKWLQRIAVRNKVHDGPKMEGHSYRTPCKPVAPGTEVDDKDMCIIEGMPVKSLITYPRSGALLTGKKSLDIRGQAWAGELEVKSIHFSIDFGVTWKAGKVQAPKNRLAWQGWNAKADLPEKGYYEVWARATDSQGNMQPMLVPGWNPKGYLNNACHRIAVKVI